MANERGGPMLIELHRALADTLAELLVDAGEPDLAGQVAELRVSRLCDCNLEGCASFSTIPRWAGRGSRAVRTQPLHPLGELQLDAAGRIVYVRILDLPDLREDLRRRLRGWRRG